MRAAPSRRWAGATYLAACAAFAGTLGALAAQVSAGSDPALGAVAAPAPVPRPRIVVTRKIIRTTVITKRVVRRPEPVAVAIGAAPTGGTGWAPAAAAPAAVNSAPSAPAQAAPAPAPSPAPAAPVTRGS